jgi:hypothetical protein
VAQWEDDVDFLDPLAGALAAQLINLLVAAIGGVRFHRADRSGPASPDRGEPPDDSWLEVRLSWRRGRTDRP